VAQNRKAQASVVEGGLNNNSISNNNDISIIVLFLVFNGTHIFIVTAKPEKNSNQQSRNFQKLYDEKKKQLMNTTNDFKEKQPDKKSPGPNNHVIEITTVKPFTTISGLISMDQVLSLPPEVPLRPDSKEPLLKYSQKRDYKTLIGHDDVCGAGGASAIDLKLENFNYTSDIFMLMVIKSACASQRRRDVIRSTWGNETWIEKNAGVKVKRFFLMGDCTNFRQSVVEENRKYNDILQWQFFDSFRNLTLKECLFLQWFARTCQNVPYIFKGDDDVFVNVKNIVKYLKELPVVKRDNLFLGTVLTRSVRILNPKCKYYVSYNLYPEKFYPPYLLGAGFIMSNKMAVRLFQTTLKTRIFPIDDAFLGTLLKQIGVEPQSDKTFKNKGIKISDVCRLAKIKTFHRMLPDRLISVWNEYTKLNISECHKSSDDVFINR